MSKPSKTEIANALDTLRSTLPPGSTVYTVIKHVARSGMYRVIDVYAIRNNQPLRLSWQTALACGYRYDRKHEGVGVSGCGQDQGYALMMAISYKIHGWQPKGDGAKPENAGRPFTPRRGHYRAGYSLNHRWL